MFETAQAYRLAVDQRLFGLGTERYGALMDTLIQLRQFQRRYGQYATTLSRRQARLLRQAQTEFDQASRARLDTLRADPTMQDANRLATAERDAQARERAAQDTQRGLDALDHRITQEEAETERLARQLHNLRQDRDQVRHEALRQAQGLGLEAEQAAHPLFVLDDEALATLATPAFDAAGEQLRQAVAERSAQADEAVEQQAQHLIEAWHDHLHGLQCLQRPPDEREAALVALADWVREPLEAARTRLQAAETRCRTARQQVDAARQVLHDDATDLRLPEGAEALAVLREPLEQLARSHSVLVGVLQAARLLHPEHQRQQDRQTHTAQDRAERPNQLAARLADEIAQRRELLTAR